ncbi:substrate-binding periplasmic protein [Roseateles sp. P5_E4]
MRRRPLLVMFAAACATEAPARPAPLVYPQHEPGRVPQWHYMQAVIKLAITRSGADYELMESPVPMTQARVVRELADRSGRIDLCWTMTSIEREARLLPVRVPMDRGLIGCRVAFVRPEDVDRWRDLHDLNELSRYVAGQGQDWPDTAILRANGLPVQGISRYEALFDMLRMRRIDYFPRAVFEIDDEATTPAAHDLVIEPHVLLRYPAASYLFVRPDRPRLAAELQRGMEAAASDGSLARLFQQYFGDLLRRHHLARRRQLLLKNPLLPPETPLHKPAYWLVIEG